MMLESYSEEFVLFHQAVAREEYLHLAGLKETLELDPIYDRYADLFTREAVANLRGELDAVSELFPTQRYAIHLLTAFAERGLIDRAVAPLTEEVAEAESAQVLSINGEAVPFHQSAVLLARESSRERRRGIYQERLRAIEAANPLRQERLQRIHELAAALGFKGYREMIEKQTGLDYRKLLTELNPWIGRSEESYRADLARALARDLSMAPQDAKRSDQPYFRRLVQYDDRFSSAGLRPAYRETLLGLGITLDGQGNIEIDDIERPRKHPRAFCSAIRVPEDIKLVVRPAGGQSDYQAFMHEGGHAQHFAWTSPTLLPVFRHAGDSAVTECYAFLFNYLVIEPLWLDDMLGFSSSDAFVTTARLHKLLDLRRYIAKLNYEVELHSAGVSEAMAAQYARLLTDATGFQYDTEECLADLDDGFYCADYLRAWALEVLLREYLWTRFGRRWWRNRRAGDILIDLWSSGQRYTAEEIAKLADLGELSFDPLFGELLEQ